MCGVVGIVYGTHNPALGKEATALLRRLEYRGYDSTGAAFFDGDGGVDLKKKVGSPTKVAEELRLEEDTGQRFVGQVRWATYGAVTDENAQPHEMSCRHHLVGAHNGNLSNTDQLKEFLHAQGHQVLSDNDGEMLVHTIEHCYDEVVAAQPVTNEEEHRRATLAGIRAACQRMEGSFAACVSFPERPGIYALKAGSSLYAGLGKDTHGEFIVVSSDLTSVLSKTRFLIPLEEGEGLYFTESDYFVFSLNEELQHRPGLRRSRFNVADIGLAPEYRYFMEQEIHSSDENLNRLLQYYFPTAEEESLFAAFEARESQCKELIDGFLRLYEVFEASQLQQQLDQLVDSPFIQQRKAEATATLAPNAGFVSEEDSFLSELAGLRAEHAPALHLIDQLLVWKKKRRVTAHREQLTQRMQRCQEAGGRIYAVGSGTSYHAILVGSGLFNQIAGLSVIPANPGMFRSCFLRSLGRHDLVLGVSQSGETKDLLDIFQEIRDQHGADIPLISLVNNELSTIPREKSDFYLPVLCGPEIAVAATKSFTNQVALFHLLACAAVMPLDQARQRLEQAKQVIAETLEAVASDVQEIADQLYLKASMHILGTSHLGLAKEGALKVREVVLNHCEGYDAAEFKHGPNTILGKNTIYSLKELEEAAGARGPFDLEQYFTNYPLVFLCGPVERDLKITISQIHTHKIRGADIFLIAQDHEGLRRAVEGVPANVKNYTGSFLRVPSTQDPDLFVYQATTVLQLLALKMSIAKMKLLNRRQIEQHGVHPDVPKNVSKSITVD